MRRRFAFLVTALALAGGGCGERGRTSQDAGAGPAPHAATTRPPRPIRDSAGIFVVLRGGDTMGVERFSRTADRLHGEVRDTTGHRLVYTAELAPAGHIGRLRMAWYLRGLRGGPYQRQTATVRGDTLVLRTIRRGEPRERRIHVAPGTEPYILPSVAMAELLLRRARAAGGDSARVPLYVIGLGYRLFPTVHWLGRDSARIEVSGNRLPVSLDGAGQILAGGDALLGVRVERLDSLQRSHPGR